MASIQFYLRTGIKNSSNQHPIYVRITANQKSSYQSLDIWIKKSQWNQGKQKVRKTQRLSDTSDISNEYLSEIRALFHNKLREIKARNKIKKIKGEAVYRITAAEIKKKIFNPQSQESQAYFIAYARRQNNRIKKEDRYNTFKKNRAILNKFEKYISSLSGIPGSDILFSEITISLLKQYHTYLLEEVGNSKNTAHKNIKDLGTLYRYAIQDEIISYKSDPFLYISFPTTKTKKVFLTTDELEKLVNLNLKAGSLIWHVRNYYFFQVYAAGLRVSDLCTITWDAITAERFEYTMRKTSRHKSLYLVEPAREILEMYKPQEPGKAIFDILARPLEKYKSQTEVDKEIIRKTALINKYLGKLEKKAKLKKHITTHIARHTFANLALKAGWSKEQIQKALAHSSVKQTEQYLSSFEDYNIDQNMKSLFKAESKWIDKFNPAA